MTPTEIIEKAKQEVAKEYSPFPPSFKETLNQVTLRALRIQREELITKISKFFSLDVEQTKELLIEIEQHESKTL